MFPPSSSLSVMVDLVEAFQTVVNEAVEIQNDEVEAVTEAVDSVEVVVEIQTDVVEAATEAVEEIQTDVAEGATEAEILVVTETVVILDVTLDEVVKTVNATMSAQMNAIGKPEENGQAMHTTEGLNPFVLDDIKGRIETTEVNGRDSRSPLLGCA